jgi:hypothetical protein
LTSDTGEVVNLQARANAFWPDRSIKWVLLDFFAAVAASGRTAYSLTCLPDSHNVPVKADGCRIDKTAETWVVNTGSARFSIPVDVLGPFSAVAIGDACLLSSPGSEVQLADAREWFCQPVIGEVIEEENGPVRTAIRIEGEFYGRRMTPFCRFMTRMVFYTGCSSVVMELQVHNPRAAHHPGGLWDLGDKGSVHFKDLSLVFHLSGSFKHLAWDSGDKHANNCAPGPQWVLYQDSSGGANWDSANHVDHSGKVSVQFRGYRVVCGKNSLDMPDYCGERATPWVRLATSVGGIAAGVSGFWQNFPKTLQVDDTCLRIALFPRECTAMFELQGGEKKCHNIVLNFGLESSDTELASLLNPLHVFTEPQWIERTAAVPYFVPQADDPNQRYLQYISRVVEGGDSFFEKRELIDEYGWRHFGDLYADHEAVKHKGPGRLVSHYNNQYDFIYGALFHYLRTGDRRWFELGQAAAMHTVDIDIYHTDKDRPAYNRGLFWHTDHYKDACTCAHRTYSRRNAGDSNYGGGPSNEHNYTSGLLLYFYLTGDPEAAAAVLELADWVIGMDDGSRTIFGLIDEGPTGAASSTADSRYQKAGRGAGNSINALMDAYRISNKRRYLTKAEELILRCIHPKDDIASLKLDDPEYRWSYLVFLQSLGKYLDLKGELGESDYYFFYARDSLLQYANWMLENEVPYKDVLHKVLIPTETWPAHDIRKCHVFHLAAYYGPEPKRPAYRQKAEFFFERCIGDLLSFDSAYLTRPLVILAAYGGVHAFFQKYHVALQGNELHGHDFGLPQKFLTQRDRLKEALKRKTRLLTHFLLTIIASKISILRSLGK